MATERFGLDFRCTDITSITDILHPCDLALLNSVLHHLDDAQADATISTAACHLKPGGTLIVLDMVTPEAISLNTLTRRWLISLDRGQYCRSAQQLTGLLDRHFDSVQGTRSVMRLLGIPLWDVMLYVCHKSGKSDASRSPWDGNHGTHTDTKARRGYDSKRRHCRQG